MIGGGPHETVRLYARADAARSAPRNWPHDGARLIAGGTNLLDLMKLEVETPGRLVDINRLPLGGIETRRGRVCASARWSATARAPPTCASAATIRCWRARILAGATFQLRNKATTGGNLCQRTRCYYFYNTDMPCNKREPGSGCSAVGGANRIHAVLGASEQCIATYPGDMAVGLSALMRRSRSQRLTAAGATCRCATSIACRAMRRTRDNVLEPGEVITAVMLPAPVGGRQFYRKVRDRSSYAFALVSIAAVVLMEGGRPSLPPRWRSAAWRISPGTIRGSTNCLPALCHLMRCSTKRPTCCSRAPSAMAAMTSRFCSPDGRSRPCCAKQQEMPHDPLADDGPARRPQPARRMHQGVIGKPLDRPDGPAKTTGTATYAAEYPISGCVEGVLVTATISRGRGNGARRQLGSRHARCDRRDFGRANDRALGAGRSREGASSEGAAGRVLRAADRGCRRRNVRAGARCGRSTLQSRIARTKV